jgi:hypothetical protein
MSDRPRLLSLVMVPAIITLAVTLLRLTGELQNWSPRFFSRQAGGAGAIVGIVWLVPIFGIYFALKLVDAGERPAHLGRAALFPVLAIAPVALLGVLTRNAGALINLLGVALGAMVAAWIACQGWPALGRVLFAYALAARIPVAIVMLLAILGDWGTHYDVPPPAPLPVTSPFVKWVLIGLIPQMTIWIAFTLMVGGLFGALAVAVARRKGRTPVASAA